MTDDQGVDAPTVLVVDDEEGLADLYSVWLDDCATVKTAYTGESALGALDEAVDVVLLDRRMPDIAGDEVLETIRERHINARVAMVSGVSPDVDIIDMGFDEYLTKPVSRDDLRRTVDRLFARSEYDDHIQELLTLVSKRAAIETQADSAHLAESEEYRELNARIQNHRSAADEILRSFEEPDIKAVLRDAKLSAQVDGGNSPGVQTFSGLYSIGDDA